MRVLIGSLLRPPFRSIIKEKYTKESGSGLLPRRGFFSLLFSALSLDPVGNPLPFVYFLTRDFRLEADFLSFEHRNARPFFP